MQLALGYTELAHLPLEKIATISQTTFSSVFSWKKVLYFDSNFAPTFVPNVSINNKSELVSLWFGAEQVARHYLNQCWPISVTHRLNSGIIAHGGNITHFGLDASAVTGANLLIG